MSLNPNNQLSAFIKKSDLEQGTILLQNITVSKKNFNFRIFKKKENLINDKENEEEKKSQEENELEIKNNIDFGDPIFKDCNIKIDGNSKLLGSRQYYREIIREKLLVELSYKNE